MSAPMPTRKITDDPTPELAPRLSTASPMTRAWRRFRANKLALIGTTVVIILVLFCFVGPLVWRTDQVMVDLLGNNQPWGSPGHPLGTDALGYD
ncbi:MAG: hypothetical protein FWF36_07060, partial [Propionibacteriaceae bacterium]|nr:hypothetical protein [Propionibacteriaceae bacterium]